MRIFYCILALLLSVYLVKTEAHPRAKRIIMIALDGISIKGLEKAETPNIDKLMKSGAASLNTRVVMPSVTLPNWTSHLTGSGPEQHGVTDNNWQINSFKLKAVDTDKKGYYPSVFKVLKDNLKDCKTAFYYNWKNLIYPYNIEYFDEISYLENDEYIGNYQKAFEFILNNKKNPTLVFLYSVHTDHAGHKFKWMSKEYIKSIEDADKHIGELIKKMKDNNLYKDSYFMFLSDHGGIGHGHGGLTEDEMIVPWAISGPKIKEDYIISEPNNTVNTATTILYLFKVKKPLSWTGEIPYSIFR